MKLSKLTPRRKRRDGKWARRYPRCQHVEAGEQCVKSVYADERCFAHYTPQYTPSGQRIYFWI